MLFGHLLQNLVKIGELTVVDADGRTHVFTGREPGPTIKIRLHDKKLHSRLFFDPMLRLPEAYVDGSLTVEDGKSCYDFMEFAAMNLGLAGSTHWVQRLLGGVRWLGRKVAQYNPAHRSRTNVAHHYDLSGELYELFLDADRQYSCAYFGTPDDSLEMAQARKKRHIAAKLLLEPGQKVLDIGSGWGGLGLYLAERGQVDVTGVTLSEEQHKLSNQRAENAGLNDRVRFELQDYRAIDGQFDRIVSVGMFEHVGVGHYREFFTRVRKLLTADGVALLHTIGRSDGPGFTNPWIDKYIFPGGYAPALSEVIPAIEKAGLYVTDIEVLRLHYAETLRHWRRRFLDNVERARALYDDRFCRMWELYLAASETAFRYSGQVVFQIQLAGRQDSVPLVRDYITAFENDRSNSLAAAE